MSRSTKIIIAYVVVVLLVVVSLLIFNHHKSSVAQIKTIITTNKDTGQTIITDQGQTAESYGSNNYVTILGANKLLPAGMTISQFDVFDKLITNYVNINLKRQYTQVSILNNGFSNTSTSISAKLRLGSSQILLNLTILYPSVSTIEVIISNDTNSSYYAYNSGLQTAQ